MAPEIETLAPVAGVAPVAPVAAGPLNLEHFAAGAVGLTCTQPGVYVIIDPADNPDAYKP